MIKKLFITSLVFSTHIFCSTVPTSSSSYGYSSSTSHAYLSERDAQQHVKKILSSIESAFRYSLKYSKLRHLKDFISNQVFSSGTYEWTPYGKSFNKDLINQVIASALLQFIEESAYRYAYKLTHNSSTARSIANSMRNNAMVRIDSYGFNTFEALAEFVGSPLKGLIKKVVSNSYSSSSYTSASSSSSSSASPAVVYPSEECIICYDSLSSSNRVFLSPCGHDLCKQCTRSWFFTGNHTTCPTCRTSIDKNALSHSLSR